MGSPDVWYDGPAGPYSIRVLVRPPRVVPGLADIVVRVRGGAEQVLVAPARWDTGDQGTPAPDVAKRVRGDTELFSAQLWLMARGSYRIVVSIQGQAGPGSIVVPVTATATERLRMPWLMGGILLGALAFLCVGLLTAVGAAVRESVLPPGEAPSAERIRRARAAMAGAGLIITLLLVSGWRWWGAVDAEHRARLDRMWKADATVLNLARGERALRFTITDSLWLMGGNRAVRSPIIPDHGKLMHMFLVREDQAGFAHVHPITLDSINFIVRLPALPAGRYTVYADLVHESGGTHTLIARTELNDGPATPAAPVVPDLDPDDASWSGAPGLSLTTATSTLVDGSSMRWTGPMQIVAGEEMDLRIAVTDAAGAPAALEPYLGMPGHMVIQRQDASVFVHLHPLGTISPAAQRALALGPAQLPPHEGAHLALQGGSIVFPYAFPKPGRYRVWAQVRHKEQVLTGVFDLEVTASH
ncbi:MAG: hypothetical protein ACRENP_13420 [Longimicrobiales bacterium]